MGRAAPATRAHEPPPPISDGSSWKVVLLCCFFRSISVECTSPLKTVRSTSSKNTINFCKNAKSKKLHTDSRRVMRCRDPRKEKHTATELHRGGLAQGLAQQRVRKD